MAKLWIHGEEDQSLPEDYWEKIEKLLLEAPFHGTGLDVVDEKSDWRFDNRWRAYDGVKGKHAYGNGLDFMVAYNLYWLTRPRHAAKP